MSGPATIETASQERTDELVASLTEVRSRVKASSLPNTSPTLVAVSKLKPASDILVCYNAGQLDFGENYVQELEDKARILPADIRWHFIGTLQSNKSKTLASIPNLFSVQTIGSIKSASALNKALPPNRTSPLKVLLQVNTSEEDSKSGLPPLTPSSDLVNSELIILAQHILSQCPQLRLEGLMTIGALDLSLSASETQKNADFEKLKETGELLAKHLNSTYGEGRKQWGEEQSGRLLLSMGMSSDYEAALKYGSDTVRVGTGIFGQRVKKT